MPGVFLRDLHSINVENAAVWRSWQRGGKAMGSRRVTLRGALVCAIDRKIPPFWETDFFSNELLLSSFHLGEKNFPDFIRVIKEYAPFDLYAYPSTAYLLAEYNWRTNAGLKFGAVFTSSEMVFDHQREMIEKSFQCKIFDWYGQAERVAAISPCDLGNYHVSDDYSITEIIRDDQGRQEIVGTTLFNSVMPLIRYRTGDYVKIASDKCSCGCSFRCIQSIDGREGGYLQTPEGTRIGVAAITHVPRGINHLIETQFVQSSLDEIVIRVICSDFFSKKEEDRLIKNAVEHISKSVNFRVEKVVHIPQGKNGKFEPIISRLNI